MQWYWAAVIAGIVAPWLIMGGSIRAGFEQGGLQVGLGIWFGLCIFTMPYVTIGTGRSGRAALPKNVGVEAYGNHAIVFSDRGGAIPQHY